MTGTPSSAAKASWGRARSIIWLSILDRVGRGEAVSQEARRSRGTGQRCREVNNSRPCVTYVSEQRQCYLLLAKILGRQLVKAREQATQEVVGYFSRRVGCFSVQHSATPLAMGRASPDRRTAAMEGGRNWSEGTVAMRDP